MHDGSVPGEGLFSLTATQLRHASDTRVTAAPPRRQGSKKKARQSGRSRPRKRRSVPLAEGTEPTRVRGESGRPRRRRRPSEALDRKDEENRPDEEPAAAFPGGRARESTGARDQDRDQEQAQGGGRATGEEEEEEEEEGGTPAPAGLLGLPPPWGASLEAAKRARAPACPLRAAVAAIVRRPPLPRAPAGLADPKPAVPLDPSPMRMRICFLPKRREKSDEMVSPMAAGSRSLANSLAQGAPAATGAGRRARGQKGSSGSPAGGGGEAEAKAKAKATRRVAGRARRSR